MKEYRIYGPPGCQSADMIINIRRGKRNSGRAYTIEQAYYKFNKLDIPKKFGSNYPWRSEHDSMALSLQNGIIQYHAIAGIVYSGIQTLYKLTTISNRTLTVTIDHSFKTETGFKKLKNLSIGSKVLCRSLDVTAKGRRKIRKRKTVCLKYHPNAWINNQVSYSKIVYEAVLNNLSTKEFINILKNDENKSKTLKYLDKDIMLHHKDNDSLNDDYLNLEAVTKEWHDKHHANIENLGYFNPVADVIKSIKCIGEGPTYDIAMAPPYHNYVAQDFIVHNTGKTRVLARRHIPRAIEKYGPDKVMVASFTRAAAKEIASRDIKVDERNVGTLHSLCYRAFGQPDLAVKHIKEWNAANPRWTLSGSGKSADEYDDCFNPSESGDKILSEIQILKAKMIPESTWKISLRSFKKAWDGFKKEMNVVDFEDLIENAIEEFPIAPNNPAVMFLDEAQDFTPIQFKLIRLWGMSMEWFVMCADDDQTLYGWIGADVKALINPPIPDEFKTVLKQSWRVPENILKVANKIISKVSVREPKEYRARMDDNLDPVPGEVIYHDDNFKAPDSVLELGLKYTEQNKSVMFLASCSYMLEPLKHLLRSKGIPFHNPYRLQRYDWNPFYRSNGISSINLLINFLDKSDGTYWSVPQFLKWAKFIKVGETGLIKKNGKKALAVLEKAVDDCVLGLHTTREVLRDILSPAAVNAALDRDVRWLKDNVLKARVNSLDYPMKVLKYRGAETLRKKPKCILGTVHSVKGGEADCVVVFPDISRAAYMEKDNKDAIRRMFYVAVTRARETLILCSPALPPSGFPATYFEWPR